MSWTDWIVLLGAALEIAGFGLAFFEIRGTERAFNRTHAFADFVAMAAQFSGTGRVSGTLTTGQPIADRPELLETQVSRLRDHALPELEARVLEAAEAQSTQRAARLQEEMVARDDSIRALLREVALVGIGQRKLGLALFVAGLALQTIAQIAA